MKCTFKDCQRLLFEIHQYMTVQFLFDAGQMGVFESDFHFMPTWQGRVIGAAVEC